jgi:hypothetical protein
LDLASQAQGSLKLEALDVAAAHLARGIRRDPEDVPELRVVELSDNLFEALIKGRVSHRSQNITQRRSFETVPAPALPTTISQHSRP